MSIYGIVTICDNIEIIHGIWQMELYAPQIAAISIPGQFINLYLDDDTLLLPHPISLSAILSERLQIIYRVVEKGTKRFSALYLDRPDIYDYYMIHCAIHLAFACSMRGGEVGGAQWQ